MHNKLLKIVEDVAKNNKINVQMRTVSRSTGTDTESFAYANDGCPSVLISIPLRYMGQAAGFAAVQSLQKDCDAKLVDVAMLREQLVQVGQILEVSSIEADTSRNGWKNNFQQKCCGRSLQRRKRLNVSCSK